MAEMTEEEFKENADAAQKEILEVLTRRGLVLIPEFSLRPAPKSNKAPSPIVMPPSGIVSSGEISPADLMGAMGDDLTRPGDEIGDGKPTFLKG